MRLPRPCFTALVGFLSIVAASAAPAADAPPAPDEGLVSIFNGKDFAGWVQEGATAGKDKTPIWSVREGTIHCTGQGFGFLRYDRPLKDFVFEVEYRMSERCNSGVGVRGVKFTGPRDTRPSFAAYEIQILDDAGKSPSPHSSGSLYRYVAPKVNASKPAGQWNTLRVECCGPRIRATLNGQTIHDLDQTQVAETKDKPLAGYVALQTHSRGIEFRNPRLKVLEPEKK